MKKLLISGILALAAVGMMSAQEGLQFSGNLKTGVRLDFMGGDEELNGAPARDGNTGLGKPFTVAEPDMWAPTLGFWNDDAANRFDLNMIYNKSNYGFKVTGRGQFYSFYGNNGVDISFPNAFGWFEVLGGMLNLKFGAIDDSVWNAPGVEDFHYSTGLGFRLEAKPIDGLNVGLFVRPAQASRAYWGNYLDKNGGGFIHPSTEGDSYSRLADALLETSIGAKYESDLFDAAFGFQLASEASGARTMDHNFGLGFYKFGMTDTPRPTWPTSDGYDDVKGVGFAFYLGAAIKVVDNLTLEIGAQLANLGAFDKYGWVWITQKIGYELNDTMSFGLNAQQKILTADEDNSKAGPGYWAPDADVAANAALEFVPWFDYKMSDKLTVGVEIPLAFQPYIVDIDLGIKPKVSYQFGEQLALNAYYRFNVTAFNEDNFRKGVLIRNAIQLSLDWSF